MYSSIRIQGYRGLDSFRMQRLGRVNLLVGTNNCGKTSVLECIALLRSACDPRVLSAIAERRGELAHTDDGDARAPFAARTDLADVSHLFRNHQMDGTINIEAERVGEEPAGSHDELTICVKDPSTHEHDERDTVQEGDDVDARPALSIDWSHGFAGFSVQLGLTQEGLFRGTRRLARARNGSSQAVQFVRTSGLTSADVVRTFSKFVLTPKEENITRALRIIEPALERIAPIGDDSRRIDRYAPGGVVAKLREVADRVPIGSLGDGMWRILGLALSIADAESGVLLVDEIDTGLHYSVMEDMWRMISKQAAALSVQVFATTHSRDCYESLAAIAGTDSDGVTIQRIDRSRGEAVGYSREAVVAAAERGVEVR